MDLLRKITLPIETGDEVESLCRDGDHLVNDEFFVEANDDIQIDDVTDHSGVHVLKVRTEFEVEDSLPIFDERSFVREETISDESVCSKTSIRPNAVLFSRVITEPDFGTG